MRKHHMTQRHIPTEIYRELLHSKKLDTRDIILDTLLDYSDALSLTQREIVTLRQKVEHLEAENKFLIKQLQEGEE